MRRIAAGPQLTAPQPMNAGFAPRLTVRKLRPVAHRQHVIAHTLKRSVWPCAVSWREQRLTD